MNLASRIFRRVQTIVLVAGMALGTLFTLFLVPTWYVLVERIEHWIRDAIRRDNSDQALQSAE